MDLAPLSWRHCCRIGQDWSRLEVEVKTWDPVYPEAAMDPCVANVCPERGKNVCSERRWHAGGGIAPSDWKAQDGAVGMPVSGGSGTIYTRVGEERGT
jgi:hypothetical protein